jgi:glucose/arabinose dehydrogenase
MKKKFSFSILLVLSLALLAIVGVMGCGEDDSAPVVIVSPSAPADPRIPTPFSTPSSTPSPERLTNVQLMLEPVGGAFVQPLYITGAGDGSDRLFVVEKEGRVIILRQGQEIQQVAEPFLDIRERVSSQASERGLLSIAFSPTYASNGQFYLNYTNLEGNTVIARYHVSDNPDQADPASEEILLTISQPAANHNGGLILFGPDGYLYVGMGDGGMAGDPWGNAQNRSVLLGKLLRLDVEPTGETGTPYAIPPDNPFVGRDDMRPEIWAWGLRNPWRFSFDRATDDLYIGDVGQNRYEELHYQPAGSAGGENYGWDIIEGESCFPEGERCDKSGLELPILVYSHSGSDCSITGGYVYRGSAFPALRGIYFFADYCSGKLWGAIQTPSGWQSALLRNTGMSISSFGEDDRGELYLSDLWGGKIYRVGSE